MFRNINDLYSLLADKLSWNFLESLFISTLFITVQKKNQVCEFAIILITKYSGLREVEKVFDAHDLLKTFTISIYTSYCIKPGTIWNYFPGVLYFAIYFLSLLGDWNRRLKYEKREKYLYCCTFLTRNN